MSKPEGILIQFVWLLAELFGEEIYLVHNHNDLEG